MVFGKNKDKGLHRKGPGMPVVVTLGSGFDERDLLVHNEQGPIASSFLLSQLEYPEFPEPIGVFRNVQLTAFDQAMKHQIEAVTAKNGPGDLHDLLYSGETWEVR